MAEFEYQNVEAWQTALRLTVAVGRLKVGSNLKASADSQAKAFEQAGLACALIAEGAGREGGAQVALYRDARGALAQCRSWLHVLASLMNEQETAFANEFDLAELGSRQLTAMLRVLDRGEGMGGGPNVRPPAGRQAPPPPPRPAGSRPGPGGPR